MKNVFAGIFNWKVDEKTLKNQIDNYSKLKIYQSLRGIAALLIEFSVVLTAIILYFTGGLPTADILTGIIIYVVIFSIIALFVYRGSRVALILAMILFTLDKAFSIAQGPTYVVAELAWWVIFMRSFWQAYAVERERRKLMAASRT